MQRRSVDAAYLLLQLRGNLSNHHRYKEQLIAQMPADGQLPLVFVTCPLHPVPAPARSHQTRIDTCSPTETASSTDKNQSHLTATYNTNRDIATRNVSIYAAQHEKLHHFFPPGTIDYTPLETPVLHYTYFRCIRALTPVQLREWGEAACLDPSVDASAFDKFKSNRSRINKLTLNNTVCGIHYGGECVGVRGRCLKSLINTG